jgi:hypothetical protein
LSPIWAGWQLSWAPAAKLVMTHACPFAVSHFDMLGVHHWGQLDAFWQTPPDDPLGQQSSPLLVWQSESSEQALAHDCWQVPPDVMTLPSGDSVPGGPFELLLEQPAAHANAVQTTKKTTEV